MNIQFRYINLSESTCFCIKKHFGTLAFCHRIGWIETLSDGLKKGLERKGHLFCLIFFIQWSDWCLKVAYRYTSTSATFVSLQTVLLFDDSQFGNRSKTAIFGHLEGRVFLWLTIYPAGTVCFNDCSHCKKYQRYQ